MERSKKIRQITDNISKHLHTINSIYTALLSPCNTTIFAHGDPLLQCAFSHATPLLPFSGSLSHLVQIEIVKQTAQHRIQVLLILAPTFTERSNIQKDQIDKIQNGDKDADVDVGIVASLIIASSCFPSHLHIYIHAKDKDRNAASDKYHRIWPSKSQLRHFCHRSTVAEYTALWGEIINSNSAISVLCYPA
jgi:hypothetical protein